MAGEAGVVVDMRSFSVRSRAQRRAEAMRRHPSYIARHMSPGWDSQTSAVVSEFRRG